MVVQYQKEVNESLAGPAGEGRSDQLGFPVPSDHGTAEYQLEVRRGPEKVADQRAQFLQHFVGRVALGRGVQQRLGVDLGDALGADVGMKMEGAVRAVAGMLVGLVH